MRRIVLLVGVLALVAAACGSVNEIASEQILENIDGVDDVAIDSDTGQIKVETEDGSLTIGGGEIPDNLEFPVPDGGAVLASFATDDAVSLTIEYPVDSYEDIVSFYASWVDSQSSEWSNSSQTFDSAEGVTIESETWFGESGTIGVTTCPSSDGSTAQERATCVTLLQE